MSFQVVRVGGAYHHLQVRMHAPKVGDGFHAIPSRRHADIHKRQRVGTAFGHRLFQFRQTLLALVGRVDLELGDRHRLHAKQQSFIVLQAFLRVNFAEQDFAQIVVNRLVVVDDEDPVIGLKQRG